MYIKNIIHSLVNFLQMMASSDLMTVICRNYSLKYGASSLLRKSWMKFLPVKNAHIVFFFLRSKPRNIRSVMYGIETAAAVGSRIWSSMPSELKESTSRNEFRLKIKIFTIFIGNCPCWSLFLTKLQAWRPATLLKAVSYTDVFLWLLQNF